MEKNCRDEQNDNKPKEINNVLNSNKTSLNIEDNTNTKKEQISNTQNNQNNSLNNEKNNQEIQNQNINIQDNNNISNNKINPSITDNSHINNEQNNNIQNINNINMQINPQTQINEQINQLQNNEDTTINNYSLNYYPPQDHLTQEQVQYQQQMEQKENKNIYDYETNKNLYGIAFQNGDSPLLAISSLEKSINNKIEILELIDNDLRKVYEQKLDFPCTKLLWNSNKIKGSILASSSDCIQLYNYCEETHILKNKLKLLNDKSKYCGALTSFDWNRVNDALLGTSSIDTTCTIWDLNKSSIKTQLIAHDKEVFDIQFGNDENTFISGSADGSVRLFDLRSLNHSTIIYETKDSSPINKLAWNLQNSNLIAALSLDKSVIYIFDSRANSNVSMDELDLHKGPVTGIVWAPDNDIQLCSVSEDMNVIISNVNNEQMFENTNVSYKAPCPINNVDWCKSCPEWIGITFQNKVQLLRK